MSINGYTRGFAPGVYGRVGVLAQRIDSLFGRRRRGRVAVGDVVGGGRYVWHPGPNPISGNALEILLPVDQRSG